MMKLIVFRIVIVVMFPAVLGVLLWEGLFTQVDEPAKQWIRREFGLLKIAYKGAWNERSFR